MPPHTYLMGGIQLFKHLQPLNIVTRRAIVACPCFAYAEA